MLRTHEKVEDAVVTGIPNTCRMLFLWQPSKLVQANPTGEELTEFLRERLSPYKIPVQFAFVDEIPHPQSMKPQRQGMRALFVDG